MSMSALLVSSDTVSASELRGFVFEMGGSLVPLETDRYVINDGDTDLWISLEDPAFVSEFYDKSTFDAWTAALGAQPKTFIGMRLDHTPGCLKLYLHASCKFGKKWNVVLDDIDDLVIPYGLICEKFQKMTV